MAVRGEVMPAPKPGSGKKPAPGKKPAAPKNGAPVGKKPFPKPGSKQDAGHLFPGSF